MATKIQITICPIFKTIPPQLTISFNNTESFSGRLKSKKQFEFDIANNDMFDFRVRREGRTLDTIHYDPANGFKIDSIVVNNIDIRPDIGSFQCKNNDYVKDHVVYGKEFALNGEYKLQIPYYPMKGEITKNKERFTMNGQNHEYVFFGASMTDYDFTKGIPPINGKNNYADLFIKKYSGLNLATSGQSNQEVFETVYEYLKKNSAGTIFAQLVSHCVRQVKNTVTKKIERWSAYQDANLEVIDEFTGLRLKSLQEYFVYLDTTPIISLQVPEYKKLIECANESGSKIYFISYFQDEYDVLKKAIPNSMAPYFNIDPDSKYCKDNGYHATYNEQENYFQTLVDFNQKIT